MNAMTKIQTALLIDDEKIDQMMYRRVIERTGLVDELLSFQYAEEALDHLKASDRTPVDVIFLDINMPRMNGFEFLETATRELGPGFAKAVVIMLTTSLNPRDRERAATFPVVREYISKPLSADDVQDVAHMVQGVGPI